MKSNDLTEPKQVRSEAVASSTLFYVVLAALLLIFIKTFSLLSPILLSLLLILLIFLAINPVIARMRGWAGGRKGATAMLLLGMFGMMGVTGWAFVVPMRDSVTNLTEQLPEYWERLQKPLIKLEQQAANSEKKLQTEVTTEIARENAPPSEFLADPIVEGALLEGNSEPRANPVSETHVELDRNSESEFESGTESESESGLGPVRSSLGEMFDGIIGSFTAAAFNTAQILIVLITVFFGVIFTMIHPRPIVGAVFSIVPGRHHDQALTIMERIGKFVPRWAGSTLLGMVVIGLLVFLFMWPIFGFKDALVLGLIAGVLEAVPFIGPILSAVPALLLAFGEGGMTPMWVLLAYVVIQALESNLIMPMIMANGMSLHPVAVIFSMLLCVAAFGVLGVLVAAPMVAVAGILHEELYRKRFLPSVTDADLDRLTREVLHEE